MQAIILLRVPGDPTNAEKVLSGIRFDRDFIRNNQCVVESVTVAFGASHFIIVIAGATTEQIFRGLRAIRVTLDKMVVKARGDPCTTTSTLLGWDPESELNFAAVFKRACDQACQGVKAISSLAGGEFDDFIGRLTFEEYMRERLDAVRRLVKVMSVEASVKKDDLLVDAIDAYLSG